MKKNIIFLLLITTNLIIGTQPTAKEKQIILHKLVKYNGPKTFLLSYPRSANTWMRYCLEYLTQRPTFHKTHTDKRNQPLGWLANFEIDCAKPPIEKTHVLEPGSFNKHVDKLILIVRNPKEAIQRHEHQLNSKEHLTAKGRGKLYFDNIALFDSWDPQNRILIYYEDLILAPKTTLEQVLFFLNEPPSKLDAFMKDYAEHQKKAIQIYSESNSKAADILFHSKRMKPELRKQIDQWIAELYPMQWNNYLKFRFSEAVLDYGTKNTTRATTMALLNNAMSSSKQR